jgi:phosphatidylinositol glycan class T
MSSSSCGRRRSASPRGSLATAPRLVVLSIFFLTASVLPASIVAETPPGVNNNNHDDNQSVLLNQRFDEELLVRSFAHDRDLSALHFRFTVREVIHESSLQAHGRRHFNLFPRSLGALAKEHGVLDARVSLGKGRWEPSRWGEELQPTAGGAELYGRLMDSSADAWDRFTRSMSGSLFCVGLNRLSSAQTVIPFFLDDGRSRYGVLPRETSCTENLSHWVKLLPTRAQAGLAALIVPSDVLRSPYHAMRVQIKRGCFHGVVNQGTAKETSCVNGSVALELSMSLTFLVPTSHISAMDSVVLPSPVATSSLVHFETIADGCSEDDLLRPVKTLSLHETSSTNPKTLEQMIRKYSLQTSNQVVHGNSDRLVAGDGHRRRCNSDVPVVRKSLVDETGTGGTMVITVENVGSRSAALIGVVELVPPIFNPRFSSLRVYVNQTQLSHADFLKVVKLTPRHSRAARCALVELNNVLVPPRSSVTLSYQFSKRFLQLDAFPADPNRGFDVPATVAKLTLLQNTTKAAATGQRSPSDHIFSSALLRDRRRAQTSKQAYSEGLLVMLPLPDFSMPYNVVTLSSTAMAFFFGTTVNILTRRRNIKSSSSSENSGLVSRIKAALCTRSK